MARVGAGSRPAGPRPEPTGAARTAQGSAWGMCVLLMVEVSRGAHTRMDAGRRAIGGGCHRRSDAMTTVGEQPTVTLRRLTNGYQVSQAIHVAATLGIADLLADGARDSDDLASETNTHPPAL